jgi:membrane protein DedA with SNARE-associated domain
MFAAAAPVFLLMVPESAGILIPSEATLVGAGVAVHAGVLALWVAVLAAAAGNLCGSLVAYWAGRAGVLRAPMIKHSRVVSRCEAIFERHGNRAVFLGRLLPLARTFISFPAGHAHVPLGRFVALTTAGCALWAVPFVALGALLGKGAEQVSGQFALPLAVVGIVAMWWALRSRNGSRDA